MGEQIVSQGGASVRPKFLAVVVCAAAVMSAACAGTQTDGDAAAILAQVKSADPVALAQEKPVVAVCAAVKVMAAKPAEFGLADLRTDSPVLAMGPRAQQTGRC